MFAMAEAPPGLEQRLKSEGIEVFHISEKPGHLEDAKATSHLARRLQCRWVVVDGDRFDVGFLQYLQSLGTRTFLIDDFAKRQAFPAHLILNPNLGASEDSYKRRDAVSGLLLGESYALLRREFVLWRGSRDFPEHGGHVLVTLGGSDPENLTPEIVKALAIVPSYKITVVTGPGYVHATGAWLPRSSNVQVLVNQSDMHTAMEEADLAVIAAGGTLWELLYAECAVLSYSRNPVQARVVEELEKKGAVRNLGATKAFDASNMVAAVEDISQSKELRQQMATIGRRLVDGGGAARVVQELRRREGSW